MSDELNLEQMPHLLERLTAVGEDAPDLDEKVRLATAIRKHSKQASKQLDGFLLERAESLCEGLDGARKSQERLRGMLDKLTATPWFPAVFLEAVETDDGPAALVVQGSTRRLVGLAEGVDIASLAPGDEVLLSHELNVLTAKSSGEAARCGETAIFERWSGDGRMVVRWREEELVVRAAARLADEDLTTGDLLRWDRTAWLALEKLERSEGGHLFLEEKPEESFADIGGLDRQIETLQRAIRLHLYHRETVERYRLRRKGSVLLVGPPGTGKTMMARALSSWLAEISGSGRSRFMNIKPSGLHSSWYAQTEANYREAFRVAREAGVAEPEVPVVMFFDEVDSLGAARGDSHMRIDDRVLTAFMTELDGLEGRGNILVVAATNRRDALDPALLRPGRLGDLVLEVPRPGMGAAGDIFGKYLSVDLPYAVDAASDDAEALRQSLIEAAVSRIYAPNGDNDLAVLTFRDGRQRPVEARDLMNGATIAKVARAAVERACVREIEGGEAGVRLEDLLTSIGEEFESAVKTLTPANCHQHLDDLPSDVDVVRVEPVERRVRRPHRYLNVA